MAKIKLEHAPNCYLRTGGAPVEPFCSCGATEAMDEIDRLTTEKTELIKTFEGCSKCKGQYEAELAKLKDELTCEECEQSLVDPETGVTALCMTCWNAMVTKLRAEIDSLKAELKAKDAALEKLARLWY